MVEDQSNNTLGIRYLFDAPVAQVYEAFTDPTLIKEWWAPKGYRTPHVEMDLRPGGAYRFGMSADGETELMFVHGVYLDVVPNELLVFTYVWEGTGTGARWVPFGLVGHPTRVTIQFDPRGRGTEVTLTHERFPDAAGRDEHRFGWTSCLECLSEFLAVGS